MSGKLWFASLLVPVALWPTSAFGAPVVQAVSGSVQGGGVITIQGTGFGTKGTAEPIAYEDFESYDISTNLSEINRLGSDYSFAMANSSFPPPDNVVASCPIGRSGKTSHFIFTRDIPDRAGYIQLYRTDARIQGARYLYMDAWVYATGPGTTWTGESDNGAYQWKTFGVVNNAVSWQTTCGSRFCEFTGPTVPDHRFTTLVAAQWGATLAPGESRYGDAIPNDGTWHHLRYMLDKGSAPTYGSERLFDGDTELWSAVLYYPESCMDAFVFGCDNANAYDGRMNVYWDDVYFDNSWARVEIGNAPLYSNCTRTEVQVPSAWSASAITCTLKQGSFGNGQQVYVFVTDPTGAVSEQGFPVTLGGEIPDSPPTISCAPPPPNETDTSIATVSLSGTASDDHGLAQVIWENSMGGGGTAANSSGDWRSWAIDDVSLSPGINVVTVSVIDSIGQSSSVVLNITCPAQPGQPALH